MLDSAFERKNIIIKLPKSLLKIEAMIEAKSEKLGIDVINLRNHNFTEPFSIPPSIHGVFIYNDGDFDTAILISSLLKYIPKVFLLSENPIKYTNSSLLICHPGYKKIEGLIDQYLDEILLNKDDFLVEKSKDGFKYITYGDIKINPYQGLFVSIDSPNGHGYTLGAYLDKQLNEQKIEHFFDHEPTNEMFGGIAKSALREKLNCILIHSSFFLLLIE